MNSEAKTLVKNFEQLNDTDRSSLMAFSEFLLTRTDEFSQPKKLVQPEDISRPIEESVVVAIKRLSKTYPMISKSGVLDQSAQLMTDHMLHGKEAKLVINELEVLFSQKYQEYCDTFESEQNPDK